MTSKTHVKASLRDIAKASGHGLSTVSMALRNDPRISQATRDKISKIATESEYVRDPHVSAIMNYMRTKRINKAQAELAFITTVSQKVRMKDHPIFFNYYEGAKTRAQKLGFNLIRFDTEREGLSSQRLTDILEARGIGGIIVAPFIGKTGHFDFDFSRFTSITFGYSVENRNLNRITLDHYQSTKQVFREIFSRGFQKVGIIVPKDQNIRLQYRWMGAIYAYLIEKSLSFDSISLYEGNYEEEPFLHWFKGEKPEVIISPTIAWAGLLNEKGIRCPRDYRFINLEHESLEHQINLKHNKFFSEDFRNSTAIDQESYFTGEQSVELLANQMALNIKGLSEHPSLTMISPRWIEGDTLGNA